jgi:hypothetical protein
MAIGVREVRLHDPPVAVSISVCPMKHSAAAAPSAFL